MKILVLSDDFAPHSLGGAGLIAENLAREFLRRGYDVAVVTTVRAREDAGTFHERGLVIHRLATSYNLFFQAYVSLWNRRVVNEVKKIIADFKPDIVHAHNVHGYLSYRSLVEAQRSGARVILTCHDVMSFHFGKFTEFIDRDNLSVPAKFNYHVSAFRQARAYRFRYNPWRNMIIRRILAHSVDEVIAVSNALKQAMVANGIGNGQDKNISVVYNGISPEEWRVTEDEIRSFKKSHNLENKRIILFGGRLGGAKGGGEVVRAMEMVKGKFRNAVLLVVGTKQGYGERLEVEAKRIGIDIHFTGWLQGQDLHAAYGSADIVTFPSVCFDTFGMVNLEGMIMKKPVVATCFGGAPEVVLDGTTGYIVNPYNIKMLAEKIMLLLTDEKKMKAFGEAGYERVLDHFTLKDQADAYELLFNV